MKITKKFIYVAQNIASVSFLCIREKEKKVKYMKEETNIFCIFRDRGGCRLI